METRHQGHILAEYAVKHNCKSYLEIGLDKGCTFFNVPCERKVGVDPTILHVLVQNMVFHEFYFRIVNDGALPNLKIYPITSDEYFKNNTESFDMIFIDGHHGNEQVKKDIDNALLRLNNNGTIFVHDTCPTTLEYASPELPKESKDGFWIGDGYKSIIDLRVNRKDLYIETLDVPCGISRIVRNKVTVIVDGRPIFQTYSIIDKKYLNYDWQQFYDEHKTILNMREKWTE